MAARSKELQPLNHLGLRVRIPLWEWIFFSCVGGDLDHSFRGMLHCEFMSDFV